jgi:hypothetical protein
MPTLINTIKKANRITGSQPDTNGQFFYYNYKGHTLSFARRSNSDIATCFYTKKQEVNQENQNHYVGGHFHINFSDAVKFIDTRSK